MSLPDPRNARSAIIHVMQTGGAGYRFSVGNGVPSDMWTLNGLSPDGALPLAHISKTGIRHGHTPFYMAKRIIYIWPLTDVSVFNGLSIILLSRSTA